MGGFYEGRIFRPPSEAFSLIVQATIGCSHNRCAFCTMYKEKSFRIRKTEDVIADLETARGFSNRIRRIFFADGDAFIRNTEDQLIILNAVKRVFPECERVSMYASPKSILVKTDGELELLHEAGIDLLYMGLESGDDGVLERIDKGATAAEIVLAGQRAKKAGFAISLTAILGLAGEEGSASHAIATAKAVSEMKPDYFGLLSLMLEPGCKMYDEYRQGLLKPISPLIALNESGLMLKNMDSEGTVFRANHASNYVNLKGTLNKDIERMVKEIDNAMRGRSPIKEESWRRL
ncbi:MAG: radical SAM protein [Christensenellales bacterium]|nr:radical SAM protein [Clostridiales bacterium]